MSIFKNPESCPNCVHKDVCMYKKTMLSLWQFWKKMIGFYLQE